jgi:hypothetical protein
LAPREEITARHLLDAGSRSGFLAVSTPPLVMNGRTVLWELASGPETKRGSASRS